MNPNAAPSAVSMVTVITIFGDLRELGGLEMVIWTFVPLVKGQSGNEMLSASRSFSGSLMSIN